MNGGIVFMLAHDALFPINQETGIRSDFLSLPRPGLDGCRCMQARQCLTHLLQCSSYLTLGRDIERIVTAHEGRIRSDLHHSGDIHLAVETLTADEK